MEIVIRLLNQTSLLTIGGPPEHKRWRVRHASISLTSSATVGSRYVYLEWQNSQDQANSDLCFTSQGSTSASTTTTGNGSATQGGGNNPVAWGAEPTMVGGADQLLTTGSLVAGDTYSVVITVEEEEMD